VGNFSDEALETNPIITALISSRLRSLKALDKSMPGTERLKPGIWKIAAVVLLEDAARDGNSAVGACGGDG
jgi:hypothetical protein